MFYSNLSKIYYSFRTNLVFFFVEIDDSNVYMDK